MSKEDDSVFRQRLLAKETSLRNLSKKYLAFASAIEKGSVEECQELYQGLLKELASYEFGMGKARSLINTNIQQVADYDQMHRSIEAEMETTREDIKRLAVQLQEERTIREQKEQYAVLSRRINQYPPREQTQKELVELDSELDALGQEGEAVAAKLELRAKRFAGFMHSLHDLQADLQNT